MTIIGITQILISIGGFALLPVITRTLSAYEYGIWAQINVTVSLLYPLAAMGLPIAFARFLAAEKNMIKIRESFYSVFFCVAFSGSVLSIFVFILSDALAKSLFSDPSIGCFLKAASFLIVLSSMNNLTLFYFRVFGQMRTYALLQLLDGFGRLGLIICILTAGWGLMGVIGSIIVVQIIILCISLLFIASQIGICIPKFIYIKSYLRYGVTLTPNSLIRWITDSSDRYIVGIFLGMSAVGIYSAAYAIGSLINLFISPIQLILLPELFRLFAEDKIDEVRLYLSYFLKYFLLIAIPSVIGLSMISKTILELLTPSEFSSGYIVIPFVALAGLLGGVFQIIINIVLLVQKVQYNLYINFIAAFSNLFLNIILVPRIGIVGAALATAFSYILMVLICYYVSFRYIRFRIEWLFILKSVIASVFMAGTLAFYYPNNIFELIIFIFMGVIIYSITIIVLGGLTKKEVLEIKKSICLFRSLKI